MTYGVNPTPVTAGERALRARGWFEQYAYGGMLRPRESRDSDREPAVPDGYEPAGPWRVLGMSRSPVYGHDVPTWIRWVRPAGSAP